MDLSREIRSNGEPDGETFWFRSGLVKTYPALGSGNFFGGLAFLDGLPLGNDAIAVNDAEFFILSQEEFNKLSDGHKNWP